MDRTHSARFLWAAATILATFWTSPTVQAQPAPAPDPRSDQPLRVARLVRQLGSSDFAQRSSARQELAELGDLTRPELLLAARSLHLETALAARELLSRLDVQALWQGSQTELTLDQQPAAEVLAQLSDATGNRVLIGDQFGSFQNLPVTLDGNQRTFWAALDEVCRQTGNHVRPHYDANHPGLVVLAGDAGKYPLAYAGPIRAAVTSARRQFIEEFDYRGLASEQTHSFQLNLQMMWEDRFRLVAYRSQPELVDAVTDVGGQLTSTQSAGNGWNVAGSGTRQLALNLRLSPPPVAAQSLDTLRLRWGLIAVGDMTAVDIDVSQPAAVAIEEGFELRVEQVQTMGARCELTLTVIRDLVAPEPQEVLFQENGFELFDAMDRPYRQQGQTNHLTDEGVRLRLSFAGAAPDSVPRRLRVVYPRLRSQHDLEITWRQVPLPTARPQ